MLLSCTKLPYTVNTFMCLYCECDVWNHFTAKWKPARMRFPQAHSNHCSSNRIHTPHGCTLIPVYWVGFLILCYSRLLEPTLQQPSVDLSVLFCSHIPFLCLVCVLFSVTLSSLSLLPMLKCSGLAAAQPYTTWHSFYFSDSHRLQYCHYCCLVGCFFFF